MIVFVSFRQSGLSARSTMDDCHLKVRILNGVICSEQNHGSHCLPGVRMRGLLQRHAEVKQTIIITAPSVILIAILITADGFSGTVATGWDDVFRI
jgi:hypothetical protein